MECWYWGEPFRPTLTSAYDFGSGEEYVEESYVGWGEPSVDAPEGGFVAVDAGREAACGIRPAGVLECWGSSPLASVLPPGGGVRFSECGDRARLRFAPRGSGGVLGHVCPHGGGDVPPRRGVHLNLRER